MDIIDLHTHTFYSDGVLSPSELVYRYKYRGCKTMAITDHADYTNMEFIISSLKKAKEKFNKYYDIDVLIGIELTYIPPDDLGEMIEYARKIGAELVVVHGETTAENVPPGTNLAAVTGKCDILAHPGHIDLETVKTAAENNVYIELTTRAGHSATNDEVSKMAIDNGAKLVLNTDSHMPEDLLDEEKVDRVLNQCGLQKDYFQTMIQNSMELCEIVKERIK